MLHSQRIIVCIFEPHKGHPDSAKQSSDRQSLEKVNCLCTHNVQKHLQFLQEVNNLLHSQPNLFYTLVAAVD